MATGSVIGVDLGGTKTVIVRYDATTFEPQAQERMVTRADRGLPVVMDDIVAIVDTLRTPDTTGVGIGVPGLIRQPEGVVHKTPNIPGGEGMPIKDILQKKLNLRVELDNDANCFALAEAHLGAGRGQRVVVGITLGTGVGGGIVVDGTLFRGGHGFAAEVGHMLLSPGNLPYKDSDMRGSVEQFISGTAMSKRCEQASSPQDYLEGEVCEFMRPDLFKEIAWFVTNLTYLLDPSVIVFGGSAGFALTPHLDKIRAEFPKWMLPGTSAAEMKIAEIRDSGAVGAALLVKS